MKNIPDSSDVFSFFPDGTSSPEQALGMQARVLENMGEGVSVCDEKGIISFTNPAFDEMFGYLRGELTGKHITILNNKTPEASAKIFKKVTDRLQKWGKWSAEFENRRKDGSVFFTRVRISTLEVSDRKYWVTVQEDITDRRRAVEKIEQLNAHLAERTIELEEANRQLKSANNELEAFNYTVSHDLRSPLTIISLYAQMISEICGARLDRECKTFVEGIIGYTERMEGLLSALLEFSRISRREINRETVDLSSMAREITMVLQLKEPGRKAVLNIADGLVVEGDGHLLRNVLENLLGNAWKFCRKKETTVIEFGGTEVEGRPAYYVRDNGVGFDMGAAGSLFEAFHRLHDRKEFEGHGIGLATVKRIVQRHGGKVWAEGEVGKGASIYFTIG
jgi:PAS domain S-box-containing protein